MEQKTHFLTPTKCDADVRLLYGPNRTPNESGFRFDRDSRQHLSNDNQKKLNRPTRREGKPTGDGKIGSAGECRIPSSGVSLSLNPLPLSSSLRLTMMCFLYAIVLVWLCILF
ncbi:unnamed protein product [Lathyrus oleraceus]